MSNLSGEYLGFNAFILILVVHILHSYPKKGVNIISYPIESSPLEVEGLTREVLYPEEATCKPSQATMDSLVTVLTAFYMLADFQ